LALNKKKKRKRKMKTYTFNIQYDVPEFAEITVETPDPSTNMPEAFEIAMKEFDKMYPEAIEPEVIGYR